MTNQKTTPGPWYVTGSCEDGTMVCGGPGAGVSVAAWPLAGGTPENCANARLIAAAPDLLAALRELEAIGEAGVIERRETGKPTWSALEAVKVIAQAAICKARGDE